MKPRQVRGIGSRKGKEIKWKLGKIIDETWGSQDKISVRLAGSVKVLKELRVEGSNVM